MNDHRSKRHKNVCKDVCRYNIIFLIAHLILNLFVINDVSDHHIKSFIRNLVCFFVFLDCRNCAGVKICSHYMACAKLQSSNSKNTASCSHIKELAALFHIFFQLADHKLSSLMHTGSKGCSRVNVKDHFILILCLYFLPGGNDQNIIHIKLFKILFPVVDPVNILCLVNLNAALSDIQKSS